MTSIGLRWTMGDVSDNGWQALCLAIAGARRIFGDSASYCVCLNSVSVEVGRRRLGEYASGVELVSVTRDDVPPSIRAYFDEDMAEGVAWKLAPLRIFPDAWELSLDNDCILWQMPPGMGRWLDRGDPRQCLLAEDAAGLYGQFARMCGPEPRNAGIRGLPPGFPLQEALENMLRQAAPPLQSELDEQGLQVAAVSVFAPPEVVSIQDVSICSPFPPHTLELGRCGAHFCGLNARHFPWQLEGRFAEEWIDEHWRRHLPRVRELTLETRAEAMR